MLFKSKYIKIRKDAWRTIKQGMKVASLNYPELKAYRETELTPDEIHMMSERLSEFELAGLEPREARELADRDRGIVGDVRNSIVFCANCGELLSTERYAKRFNFCPKCGKRVLKKGTESDTSSTASGPPSPRGEGLKERQCGQKIAVLEEVM